MKGINPVSDPRIFSEAQRFAQMQGVLQLAASDPTVQYNKLELHRSMLQLMKVSNIDRLLPQPQQPQPVDPAQEMIAWLSGQPVITGPQQDHIAHIFIHVNYLRDPMLGKNPIMVPITMKVLDHLKEHLGHSFAARMQQALPQAPQQAMPQQQQPPEQLMAQASMQIVTQDEEFAEQMIGIIAEAAAFVKENMDWLNPDPTIMSTRLMTEAQKVETERRLAEDERKHQQKLVEIEERRSEAERKHSMEIEKIKFEQELREKEIMSRVLENQTQAKADMERIVVQREDAFRKAMVEMWKNREDNATMLQVEAAKLAQQQLSTVVPEQPKPDMNEPLQLVMKGLQATIDASRAPRKTVAIRDENGDMVGARSELDLGE
jgi:hypothetical protein